MIYRGLVSVYRFSYYKNALSAVSCIYRGLVSVICRGLVRAFLHIYRFSSCYDML